MRIKLPLLNPLASVTTALLWCAVNLQAQSPPTVTIQPASQTNLAGSSVTFSVSVQGTGPFNYQWQFNGTNLPNNIITTAVGGGTGVGPGDGGPAANANLNYPWGVALDRTGNIYIADYLNARIRKVDANGIITTVAGSGNGGFSGDGGAATNANLDHPAGVALGASGRLYIADAFNSCVRMVDTNGIISTVAGIGGNGGYSGDGGTATNANLALPYGLASDASGNLYIADSLNARIRKVDTNGIITTVAGGGSGADGGPAINGSLNDPCGVAVDASGDLYIADSQNNCIRKVDANGIITTVAGTGNGGFSGDGGPATNASLYFPYNVALDACGRLYIADEGNCRLREVDTIGIITTAAGNGGLGYGGDGGPATNATLTSPSGVALDASGNLFIADSYNNRIREVSFSVHPILSLITVATNNAGNYTVVITNSYGSVTSAVATLTVVYQPSILAQPTSQAVLSSSNATLSVTATGTPTLYYLWYENATNLVQSGTNSTLMVEDFATNNAGNYTVVVNNAYGSVTSQIATLTLVFPPSVATQPASQIVMPGTNVLFSVAVDGTGPLSYQWQLNGTNLPNFITTVAGGGTGADGSYATNASLSRPSGMAVDAAGDLYIADPITVRIRKVNSNGIISTAAGNGSNAVLGGTYSGDGGAATNASLDDPSGVRLDAAGDLYIADSGNQRIRRVDTNGIITTVAGNGHQSYSGDGGAATNASLNYPGGVDLDASFKLYIADTRNNVIRLVGTNGIITTVVGNGYDIGAYSGDGGAATNAEINGPSGVGLDASGNLYIADSGNQRIRKVDTNGIITTFAGNGNQDYAGDGGAATNAALNAPDGLAFDAFGNLYIADTGNQCIRKVDTNGIISTVAGNGNSGYSGDGGPPTNASLSNPSAVALDTSGNLLIADTRNSRVREVFLYAEHPTLVLTNVSANNAGNYTVVISNPYGSVTSTVAPLTVQAPPLITMQPTNQTVEIGNSPVFSVAATGSGAFEYLWYLAPTNLVQSGTNNTLTLPGVVANDAGNYMVVITNAWGSVTSTVATLTLLFPPSVTTQPSSQAVLIGSDVTFSVAVAGTSPFSYQWQFNGTNLPNNVISTVAGNGTTNYAGDGGAATNAGLFNPRGAVFDGVGNLYVADSSNNRIRKINTNGIITTVAGKTGAGYSGDGGGATNASMNGPQGVALDAAGNLYIADSGNSRIRKVDADGIITTVAGKAGAGYSGDGGAATNATMDGPRGVALDAAGNLYIADYYNNRIRRVDGNGIITTVAGRNGGGYSGDGGAATSAWMNGPQGACLDAAGNLYIADTGNNRIRKVGTNGVITTVAGKTGAGYSGDGGAAINANLNAPCFVGLDAVGNMYIADYGNNRVRKVDRNGIITTAAGNGSATYAGDRGAATNASLYHPACVTLDAAGDLCIADCFNNRIREVHPYDLTFTLNSVGVSNAGNYTVVITSPYGSVTSDVAVLTVTIPRTPPQIITGDASFGFRSNKCGFNVNGAMGQTIVVDGSTDLVGWTPLFTNTVVGSPFYFFDPASNILPSRFYRARLP